MQSLKIGQWEVPRPIIQGGMGVGVSLSGLAGAVAREGGIGVISTAQIGFAEEGFERDQPAANLRAIRKHIARAKEIAGGNGLVGVNVMTALKHYADHVREAAAAGARCDHLRGRTAHGFAGADPRIRGKQRSPPSCPLPGRRS